MLPARFELATPTLCLTQESNLNFPFVKHLIYGLSTLKKCSTLIQLSYESMVGKIGVEPIPSDLFYEEESNFNLIGIICAVLPKHRTFFRFIPVFSPPQLPNLPLPLISMNLSSSRSDSNTRFQHPKCCALDQLGYYS